MASWKLCCLTLLQLSLVLAVFAQNNPLVCNNTAVSAGSLYELREGSSYCYRLFEVSYTFSAANRTCVRENGFLTRIDSREENDYINNTYFGTRQQDIWIGLSDQDVEGAFRWIDGQAFLHKESYQNWIGGTATQSNNDQYDCVKFTSNGWKVHEDFCESSKLPFLCRQKACNSSDGVNCITPEMKEVSSLSAGIIVIIAIIPVILIIIIVLVIFLLLMWKYQNDVFNRYICCCTTGGSKAQMNTLKQEIQRLQTELSQQKLNSSGRFSQGQLTRQVTQGSLTQVGVNPQIPPNVGRTSFRTFSSAKVAPMQIRSQSVSGVAPIFPHMMRSISTTQPLKPINPLPVIEEKHNNEQRKPFNEQPDSDDSGTSTESLTNEENMIAKSSTEEQKKEENEQKKLKIKQKDEGESNSKHMESDSNANKDV